MQTSSTGRALIMRHEGFSPVPYLCPAGLWTIGYGHVITPERRANLSYVNHAQAEQLLVTDMRLAERAVERFINRELVHSEFDALVSFTFNLGAGALQRSSLRRVINRDERADISHQWLRWVWAGGRKLPGLIRRRHEELALFLSADDGYVIVAG